VPVTASLASTLLEIELRDQLREAWGCGAYDLAEDLEAAEELLELIRQYAP
jgi:hypothetical protein